MNWTALEAFLSCSLALLEMTFILVALLILHGLRKIIGQSAFYISLGVLLIFTQIVSAMELKVILGFPGADFYISSSILFLPYLAALLIVYVSEGTLAAQRLIIGAMAALGVYIYLSHITIIQSNWTGYTISEGPSADTMSHLLTQSQRTLAGSILAQTLDLFLLPIFYQRLRNLDCRPFFCVLGALMFTQIVDTFVYVSACYWGTPEWWVHMNTSYIAKAFATVWLCVIAALYIQRTGEENPGESRRALDIVFAFFGGYGKAQALQQHLREWEGRYRMVVENASDMILLLNRDGMILDANIAASRILRTKSRKEIVGRFFPEIISDMRGEKIVWDNFCKSFHTEDTTDGPYISRLHCGLLSANSGMVDLDIAVSGLNLEGAPMLIVLGRDVTEQNRLAREKEELTLNLLHAQRLDSIGKLAGGVAHDFNNFIHAIQGHLDVIKYMHEVTDEKVAHHLDKVDEISQQAARLTQQLLGFARKGSHNVKVVDLSEVVRQSVELFLPSSLEGIEVESLIPSRKMLIEADPVQLKQVFMNILLNARDALEDTGGGKKEKKLVIKVAPVQAFDKIKWAPPQKREVFPSEFYCVAFTDNGCGIPKETMPRVFEPFFTTKPYGKGTGMGLAMAYGCISNHNGWIDLESTPEEGTTFLVFLPKCAKDAAELHASGQD